MAVFTTSAASVRGRNHAGRTTRPRTSAHGRQRFRAHAARGRGRAAVVPARRRRLARATSAVRETRGALRRARARASRLRHARERGRDPRRRRHGDVLPRFPRWARCRPGPRGRQFARRLDRRRGGGAQLFARADACADLAGGRAGERRARRARRDHPRMRPPRAYRESRRGRRQDPWFPQGEAGMKFVCFHLMPYRPLDMAERGRHRSAWVVLPNALYDPVKGAEEYQAYLDQLTYAETLGFDAIGVNEHHQTAYGMMPAPNLIASALIQRTKNVKIAILGRALPLVNSPIAIAEEFSMLDNLSKGRIIAGFVRGIGTEYHATGLNPSFSLERFQEAHDLIVSAWTRPGPFEFEGEHFNVRYVNLWPRPYQSPHPPIWIPSMGSSETIRWAAALERKYPFLVTFSAHDLVARYLNLYRDAAREFGYEAAGDQLGWAAPIYVADTDERARAEAKAGIESLFNQYLANPWEMLLPPGYTSLSSMKNTMRVRKALGSRARNLTIDELIESGTVIAGSPRTVREKIERMRELTGFNILVALLQFGVLSNELTRRNMDLFAAEVMPHLRG